MRIYIDRDGRAREDFQLETGPGQLTPVAQIGDPQTNVFSLLDLSTGTLIHRWSVQLPEDIAARVTSTPTEAPGESRTDTAGTRRETLGKREIEGFVCDGWRFEVAPNQGEPGYVAESWFSPELGLPLVEKKTTPKETVIFRIFDIHRTDPDPSLFAVPN